MPSIFRSTTCLGALVLLFSVAPGAHAKDDNTLVPLDGVDAPAVDLVYQGKLVDQDQAVQLRKNGVDLSTLEPVPNDLWGTPGKAAPLLPPDGTTLDYDSALAGFGHEISIHRVTLGAKPLRLGISTVSHRALLTRALLARLGYNQYQPRRYRELTLKFPTLDDRSQFLDAVTLDTVKKPSAWVTKQPDNSPELTLQDVTLEPGDVDLQTFYWAILATKFSGGRRALRALLVPISLCDAPENIDAFTWDLNRVLSNNLLMPYPREVDGQRPFDDTNIDDMRWIARKIAHLGVADWQQIVREADYPADIADLVLQKLLARRNQLLSSLGIQAAALPYNLHLSNGAVKDGQVMQASFPGYASRFSYGDAEDPMKPTEMFDFGIMQGLSSGMNAMTGQLNKYLQVLTTDPYARQHQQQVLEDFFKHLVQHPNEPYSQPVSSWGGPIAGFSVNANRQVTTGTFYGSSAPIQLVDTMGVTGSLGYFRGIDGLKNLVPSFQASVSVSRSYTHLRSLNHISDALKVGPGDFFVPRLLQDLSHVLADPKTTATNGEKSRQLADYTKAVEDMLGTLKDGEMFTITDTAQGGVAANVAIPLQAFFPAMPVGFNQNLSFGAGVQGVILRRTTLRRVHDETSGDNYLQVYVQSMDSVTGNLTLDFNYFINVLHIGASHTKGKARTRVYTIDSKPQRDQSDSQNLAESIRGLLRTNSDAMLRSNYPFYLLNHELDVRDFDVDFLFIQSKMLEERHRLRIQPPAESDHPFNPADFERTFYSYRKFKRTGNNYMALLSNILGSVTHGIGTLPGGGGDNPAFTPFGSAHWTETYSDSELTKGTDFAPVTIERETWAGWSLSKSQLWKVLDLIDGKLKGLGDFGLHVSPIHRDVFAPTTTLEFYNISTNTVFYGKGVNRIVSMVMPTGYLGQAKPGGFLGLGKDIYSPTDPRVFQALATMMGGQGVYNKSCEDFFQHGNQDSQPNTYAWWKGNGYDCLLPWMSDVLTMRRTMPSPNDREGQLEWQAKLLSLLQEQIPLVSLMNAAQKDGFFFQVQVSGFRKGDHQANDSENQEFISDYVSDSVGTVDQYAGAGALATLADKTKITSYEIDAKFFTGGN